MRDQKIHGDDPVARNAALALCLTLLMTVAGCARSSSGASPASNASALADLAPPKRIVSLAPNLTEYLFALEAGERLVGVTRYCDAPPAAQALPKVGGFVDFNFEAVVSLRPELVVTVKNSANQAFIERLERAGLRVYWTDLVGSADVFRVTRELAGLLGDTGRGEALAGRLREEMQRVGARLAGRLSRRVLVVYGHRPLIVAGPGTLVDELIRMAGSHNVAGEGSLPYPTWSMEQVIRAAPEIIIDSYMEGSDGEHLTRWGGWASVPAVREGRVVRLGTDAALRPGVRLPELYEALARALHPEEAD